MGTKIFVNLPVRDLQRTTRFFHKMGYSFDPQFSDEKAQCMIITDDIYFMLLSEPFFKTFTTKEIPDPSTTTGAIFALTADSREAVDDLLNKSIEAGGRDVSRPQMVDFMYTRAFEDPDGHRFEIIYMDMAMVRNQPKSQPV